MSHSTKERKSCLKEVDSSWVRSMFQFKNKLTTRQELFIRYTLGGCMQTRAGKLSIVDSKNDGSDGRTTAIAMALAIVLRNGHNTQVEVIVPSQMRAADITRKTKAFYLELQNSTDLIVRDTRTELACLSSASADLSKSQLLKSKQCNMVRMIPRRT